MLKMEEVIIIGIALPFLITTILLILFYSILRRNVKVYFENWDGTLGGNETISIFKLFWWLYFGKITPKEKSDRYYIRKIETDFGDRI